MINYSKVAEYVKEYYPHDVAVNAKICDDLMNNKFIFNMPWDMEATHEPVIFKDKIDWLYKPTADNEFTWQFNRHRFLINLGQQYRLTNDTKYLDKLIYLITDWINNVKLSDDIHKNKAWRSLEVGLRATTWIHAVKYIVDNPRVDDAFMQLFKSSLTEHMRYLVNVQRDFHNQSNWGVIQNHGLFAIAAYLGERDIDKGNIKVAMDRLTTEIKTQLMSDGVHWEQSPMYHTEVMICFSDVMIFANEYGIELPPQFINNISRMAHVLLQWIKPNRRQPNCGDSDYTDLSGILAKMSLLLNDSYLKSMATEHLDYESAWVFGVSGIMNYDKLNAVIPPYTDAFLEDSGHYILRSNWKIDANYLHFVNGYTGGGHAHCDKLHFDLSAHGRDFLIDSGRFTYLATDKRRNKLKSQQWHNTLGLNHRQFMINANGGWAFRKHALSIKGNVVDNDCYCLIHGTHTGYLKYNGGMVERKILWLKPSIFILYDSYYSNGISSYQRYFNFAPDVEINLIDNAVLANNSGTIIKLHFPNNVHLKVENSTLSYQYNKMIDNLRIIENSYGIGNADRITVIDCDNDCTVTRDSIYYEGKPLRKKCGCSIKIERNNDTYDILFCHKELMKYVTNADGLGGCGSIIVFKNGEKSGAIW